MAAGSGSHAAAPSSAWRARPGSTPAPAHPPQGTQHLRPRSLSILYVAVAAAFMPAMLLLDERIRKEVNA